MVPHGQLFPAHLSAHVSYLSRSFHQRTDSVVVVCGGGVAAVVVGGGVAVLVADYAAVADRN